MTRKKEQDKEAEDNARMQAKEDGCAYYVNYDKRTKKHYVSDRKDKTTVRAFDEYGHDM